MPLSVALARLHLLAFDLDLYEPPIADSDLREMSDRMWVDGSLGARA